MTANNDVIITTSNNYHKSTRLENFRESNDSQEINERQEFSEEKGYKEKIDKYGFGDRDRWLLGLKDKEFKYDKSIKDMFKDSSEMLDMIEQSQKSLKEEMEKIFANSEEHKDEIEKLEKIKEEKDAEDEKKRQTLELKIRERLAADRQNQVEQSDKPKIV